MVAGCAHHVAYWQACLEKAAFRTEWTNWERTTVALCQFCREHVQRGTCTEAGRTYSISSSARASREGGTVRPSTLATLTLTTSSNAVGCSTGRSAGFAPFRILSTLHYGHSALGWARNRLAAWVAAGENARVESNSESGAIGGSLYDLSIREMLK